MQKRASFILVMAIVLVGLSACARQQQQRGQQAGTWTSEPTYGAETEEWPEAAAEEEAARTPSEEPQQQYEGTETEDLESLGAESEAYREELAAEACPVSVEGTEVQSRDVPNGVALVFTTEGDVDELRTRVDRFAQLHNERTAGTMPTAEHRAGAEALEHARGEVASRAEVEEIDRGAQVILTPRDPTELSALRHEAERSAQSMSGGECPIRHGGQPG